VLDVSNAINSTTSENFSRYINEFRFRHAQEALQKTELLVTKVMFETGFVSKSNFNTGFRRVTGQTPSHFRAKNTARFMVGPRRDEVIVHSSVRFCLGPFFAQRSENPHRLKSVRTAGHRPTVRRMSSLCSKDIGRIAARRSRKEQHADVPSPRGRLPFPECLFPSKQCRVSTLFSRCRR